MLETSLASPSVPTRSGALSIAILAVAAFVIVSTEFLIVGLLPELARDLSISVTAAGQLVTLFAFTVMLSGPLLTAAVSHLERKRLFVAILLVFAAANALAAVAPNIWVLALARFIPALALPVFWGTASEAAAQLAGPRSAQACASRRGFCGIRACWPTSPCPSRCSPRCSLPTPIWPTCWNASPAFRRRRWVGG